MLRGRLPGVLPPLLVLLVAAAVFLEPVQRRLEQGFSAALLALGSRYQTLPDAPITLVAIDEAAIDSLGSWPWPRQAWAELLERLARQHTPQLTAIDAVFPPNPEQGEGNAAFGRALHDRPAVIGQLLLADAGERGHPVWAAAEGVPALPRRDADDQLVPWRRFAGMLGNEAVLAQAAAIGHINALIDADGVMRRVPTLLCLREDTTTCSPSLLQAMIGQLLGNPSWRLVRGGWRDAEWLLQPAGLPGLALPLDAELALTIPWRHPSGLRQISVADIWHDKLEAGELNHHILLIGGASLGLGDLATTPLHRTVAGMEVHAQTLFAWLRNELPFQPRYAAPMLAAWVALVALMLLWSARRAKRTVVITVVGAAAPLLGALLAWFTRQEIWPAATAAGYIGIAGGALLLRQALHHRSLLLARAQAYLPAPLRGLLADPDAGIPTETGWGTVMLSDIVGSTAHSHNLTLEQLAQWYEAGLEHVISHAQAHGAMLDNVAGDGALLLWRTGTPAQQAEAAAATANRILAGLPALNEALASRQLPRLALGLGVHAGPYLLGSFGAGQKRYTVISEVANLAAHIERETRNSAHPVLLSAVVARLLPAQATRATTNMIESGQHVLPLFTLADARTAVYTWPADFTPAAAHGARPLPDTP